MSEHSIGIHAFRSTFSRQLSPLTAVLCLQCGHTKLFAHRLDKVQAEVKKHPHWSTR